MAKEKIISFEREEGGGNYLTAGQLIAHLQKFDKDLKVIISGDSEGNDHSPLCGGHLCEYVAESTCNGDVYYDGEDDDREYHENAIVFYPIN